MIVREIKSKPFETIGTFDWFNDYDDTKAWAKHNCPANIVWLLDAGFEVWLDGNRPRAKHISPTK